MESSDLNKERYLELRISVNWRPLCFNAQWDSPGACHCPRDRNRTYPPNCRICPLRYRG